MAHTVMEVREINNYIISNIRDRVGIEIDRKELKKQLKKIDDNIVQYLLKDNNHCIRIELGEVNYVINELLVQLGHFDNSDEFELMCFLIENPQYKKDFEMMIPVLPLAYKLNALMNDDDSMNHDFGDVMHIITGIDEETCHIFSKLILKKLAKFMWGPKMRKKDEKIVKISELFSSEELPDDEFFSQKYVDYLSKNVEEIDKINWRQFEGLTAEYFKRNGYKVEIGKGRADGGIDITANKYGQKVLIQCKRYKEGRKVDINEVKALYFDLIEDKEAKGAIMITTSNISLGGKKIIERKYELDSKEHDDILKWLKEMERKEKL